MTPEEQRSREAHPAGGSRRPLRAVAGGSGNPVCATCSRPLMLLDARWVHRGPDGGYVYEAHRPVPANGGLVSGSATNGGPATRRYVLWLLSPVEVDAEDEDAAAAAGPKAMHALLHDTPGILEFDAQEVDDD